MSVVQKAWLWHAANFLQLKSALAIPDQYPKIACQQKRPAKV